jgi:hypothetical protein
MRRIPIINELVEKTEFLEKPGLLEIMRKFSALY